MKKSDLKSRMVVELRNGYRRLVIFDTDGELMFMGKNNWLSSGEMNDNMMHDFAPFKEYDVMKVFAPVSVFADVEKTQNVIWERQEYYSGRIICISENESCLFSKGKVYEVKNGVLESDQNHPSRKFKSFEEIESVLIPKFIEYKG